MRINRLNQLIENGKTLKGRWTLGKNHEVLYRGEDETEEEVRLKATLIAAEAGLLVLGLTQKKTDRRIETHLLKLSGIWQADSKNRLTFEIEKESGRRDILTFTGSWEVSKTHEIIYTWETTRLKTKTKILRELAIKGHWDLAEKNRLTYYVGGDSQNALHFRGTFQSRSLLAKDGEIRYQVGVEIRGKRKLQTVVLSGVWKFSHRLSLFFEIEYSDASRRKINFGGTVLLTRNSEIEILLMSKDGEPLGAEVIFTRDFFGKDGRFFVRLKKTLEESAAEAGVALTW